MNIQDQLALYDERMEERQNKIDFLKSYRIKTDGLTDEEINSMYQAYWEAEQEPPYESEDLYY